MKMDDELEETQLSDEDAGEYADRRTVEREKEAEAEKARKLKMKKRSWAGGMC